MAKLSTACARYGGIPRLLFQTLFSDGAWPQNVEAHEKHIAEQAAVLVKRVPEAAFDAFFNEEASHSVVALRPDSSLATDGKRQISAGREMMVATKYLHYRVAQAALSQNATSVKAVYEQLAGVSLLRGAAGYVFESLVHSLLGKGGNFRFTSVDGQTITRIPLTAAA
jgi:hypothetical protein